jgi:hypothetical protein
VVPVADGVSPIPDYVAVLKKIGFAGTYSLHSEYKGKGSFKDLDTEACLAQTAADLKYFKKVLEWNPSQPAPAHPAPAHPEAQKHPK